ncbi:hypothetical protein [Cohnella herbarum]|uniref:Uncharacterized protein n=1 Tax=Cohnella herbarum TaxID=2728023 RepID=A0A7Z2VPL0_9BACL|nr:hypothetical protein [Cohnella herbarum]QJD86740.1 hypothetical protein HH215_28590 [Cohnella herbarum]
MNKKLAMIGAGAVAGSVLLMSSVYAGIGGTPGYDTYKSAIKNTAVTVQNSTNKMNLTVEDNGKVLLQVNTTIKTGKDDKTGSADATLQSGETKQSIQYFNQGGKQIIKSGNSDVYKVLENDAGEEMRHESGHPDELQDPAFAREAENVIDALVGNLKNYVTLDEEGSAKEISLHLEGSQIPAVVNAVGSLIIREGGRDHGDKAQGKAADIFGLNLQTVHDSLPKLTDEIKIDAVNLGADVNADNLITSHAAEIRISGKDNQGTPHSVVVKLGMESSDFNSTTPDTVDLTGKQVENVKLSDEKTFQRWHRS